MAFQLFALSAILAIVVLMPLNYFVSLNKQDVADDSDMEVPMRLWMSLRTVPTTTTTIYSAFTHTNQH